MHGRNYTVCIALTSTLLSCACVCSAEKRPSSAGAAAGASVTPRETKDLFGVGRLEEMFEPKGPVSVLLDLAEKEAKVEEDRGADARSPLLQALVQVSWSRLHSAAPQLVNCCRRVNDGRGG